jgi:hypothetical protein
MQAVASDVLAEFKQGIIQYVPVTTASGGSPDESGTPTPGTPVTIDAVARPVSTKYVDGTNILQSDKQVTMPADGTVPEMTGLIRIDGNDYEIIEILRRPAAGVAVSYTLIVRN